MQDARTSAEVVGSYYDEIEGGECAYCGMNADTRDHVYPISAMHALVMADITNYTSVIVPACKECNCLAGSKIFPTFNEKRAYLRNTLRARYKHELSCEYTLDEMLFASDEYILHRVGLMREKRIIEGRLYFQHTYDLEASDKGRIDPLFTHIEEEVKEKHATRVESRKPANLTGHKYVFKSGSYYRVSIFRDGITHASERIPTLEEAIEIRDEILASFRVKR